MPLYWASDTDGARYCVRAACMVEAVEAFRAATAMDPEGIDMAADDDVQLIGFGAVVGSPDAACSAANAEPREWTADDVTDVLLARLKALGHHPAVHGDLVRDTLAWVRFPATGRPPDVAMQKTPQAAG